jgi:hypothetical protein
MLLYWHQNQDVFRNPSFANRSYSLHLRGMNFYVQITTSLPCTLQRGKFQNHWHQATQLLSKFRMSWGEGRTFRSKIEGEANWDAALPKVGAPPMRSQGVLRYREGFHPAVWPQLPFGLRPQLPFGLNHRTPLFRPTFQALKLLDATTLLKLTMLTQTATHGATNLNPWSSNNYKATQENAKRKKTH